MSERAERGGRGRGHTFLSCKSSGFRCKRWGFSYLAWLMNRLALNRIRSLGPLSGIMSTIEACA